MITVAMITMNEAGVVAKVIRDIKEALPDAEVLIVDSSSDKTPEIAESLGTRVIRQYPPQGYGKAMYLALTSAEGDVVVTLDCDDTYPAYEIPKITNLILNEGYDIIDGSRLKKKPEAMPWINYFANAGFAIIGSILFGVRLTDLHSGMRAYRKTLITELIEKIDPEGAALPVELLLRPLRLRKKMKVVYIDYFERVGESTMKPLESAWWTLKRIFRARFT
jgi:glycosyltransferase involved in cell wall biosynthesis|tara:strand:+ start:311 stop:973 length:663 start_codon:yes stop_codon:yes gene_type:complete